ncbi:MULTISPECIES: O-antigen polymerase [Butyricimonas]|uniref:Oligosaccharide repeat unit polymerase n=1 Tax=Butyricimonas paravirosa TaxID=1472417 RepID=A0A7X6BK22_9BACT|nr:MULTISPECIES: O-antigen polymerase [Odoribacteraceae]NJC19049.1 hypothetical protein [Butyricimonas paravirosa]WOF14648.1 oligosaccharide repeat unit polymerase [Butyricimonas paravirosa]
MNYIISWSVLLLLLPFIVSFFKWKNSERLFANIMSLIFLIRFIPGTSLMAFMPMPLNMLMYYVLYWLLICFASYIVRPTRVYNNMSNHMPIILYAIMGILCCTVLYISGVYAGFRLRLDLGSVYDLRLEARSWDLPVILTYLLPAAVTILPIFLILFWLKNKIIVVGMLTFVILLNFSVNGMKSILFFLVLCFIGYYFYNENKIRLLPWVFILILVSALFEYKFFNTYLIAGFGVIRSLFTPSKIDYYYYDFFQTHEFDYFRQSFLRWFGVSSPYKVDIARIIGNEYYGNIDNSANNGLFSDAYKNFGVIGIFVFPFILVYIFKLLNSCAKGLDFRLLTLPIFVCVTWFSSASFTNVLLTNGILLMMIVLACIPRYNSCNYD